ncbi:hypothetical protein BX659_105204 [Orenia metallireducens]|jgi:hypothetical protein|uniref:Uncharacterized protein n=1 Tax=Orenia metallireducens TaxID=1413210 RepID=A0A285G3A4_9FIRM|nr:hypothetical protein BX659_105204 [Orenia metallireducens]SNY17858.1 hypothetical protein SAMN06265827_104204 [Orenia metallireducens]
MLNSLLTIFNFLYSPYFIFISLFAGLISLLSINYRENQSSDIKILKTIGYLYILIGLFSFIFNQFAIFL